MSPVDMKSLKTGSGCVSAFGAVFLLAGLFVFYMAFKPVVLSLSATNWHQGEAIIQTTSMKTIRGDESDTYRATATYTYSYEGEDYRSDRVFFDKSSDSGRKFHRNIVRELSRHKKPSSPAVVWINPKDPGESVLYKNIRWGKLGLMTLGGFIFGGAGAGIIYMGRYAVRVAEREAKRAEQYPNQPWRWRDQWQTRTIRNDNKARTIAAVAFTTFWTLLSLPLLFILPEEILEKQNYLALIGLLFPIVALGLIYWSYKTYRHARKYREIAFELDTYPAAIGHSVAGHLSMAQDVPVDTRFDVTLSCIKKVRSDSSDSSNENILWQDEQSIPASAGRHRSKFRLPIRFNIPDDQPATDWSDDNDDVLWRLSISAKPFGKNQKQQFEIPVFDPSRYRINTPDPSMVEMYHSTTFGESGDWRETGVRFAEHLDQKLYYFPSGEHKGLAGSLILMSVIFGGVAVARFFTDIPLFMVIIFGLAAFGLIYVSAFLLFHKSQIEITPGEFGFRKGMLRGKYQLFDIGQIKSINVSSSMSSGDKKFYDIIAETTSGRKLKIANHLSGKRDVQALADKIRSDLGLEPAG